MSHTVLDERSVRGRIGPRTYNELRHLGITIHLKARFQVVSGPWPDDKPYRSECWKDVWHSRLRAVITKLAQSKERYHRPSGPALGDRRLSFLDLLPSALVTGGSHDKQLAPHFDVLFVCAGVSSAVGRYPITDFCFGIYDLLPVPGSVGHFPILPCERDNDLPYSTLARKA